MKPSDSLPHSWLHWKMLFILLVSLKFHFSFNFSLLFSLTNWFRGTLNTEWSDYLMGREHSKITLSNREHQLLYKIGLVIVYSTLFKNLWQNCVLYSSPNWAKDFRVTFFLSRQKCTSIFCCWFLNGFIQFHSLNYCPVRNLIFYFFFLFEYECIQTINGGKIFA